MASISNVDFVPSMLAKQSFTTPAVYESFSVLMNRANEWLAANPQFDALTCESIETYLAPRTWSLSSDDSCYMEHGNVNQLCYTTFLRLWVVPRKEGSGPTVIGHINVIPRCLEQGKYPKFETIQDTVAQANEILASSQPGKIMKVETIQQKFPKLPNAIDADCTHWMKYKPNTFTYLSILRIFYKKGESNGEKIGIKDFAPGKDGKQLHSAHIEPKFEKFYELMEEVCDWTKSKPVSVINLQTVTIQYEKHVDNINTDCTTVYDHLAFDYVFIHFVRVAFIEDGSGKNNKPTSRTFQPVQLSNNRATNMGDYEGIVTSMMRVEAWLQKSEAKLIGAETILKEVNTPVDRCCEFKKVRSRTAYEWCLRFYFDGPFQEPSPDDLPPVPAIEQTSSTCNIL